MTEIINDKPLLKLYKSVIDTELCEYVMNLSKGSLTKAEILTTDTCENLVNTYNRDALTTHFSNSKDPRIMSILDKIETVTGISKDRMESFTVTYYSEGQYFKLHQDFFIDIKNGQERLDKLCEYGGNRVSTLILYLNDVEKGGETHFPWINKTIKPAAGTNEFQYDYTKFDWDISKQKITKS